jgi:hybrid cluster-associated redox disulfide protein
MITPDMIITDILRRYPSTLSVFEKYGLHCCECQVADFEQLEHGAGVHNVELGSLLDELNRTIAN